MKVRSGYSSHNTRHSPHTLFMLLHASSCLRVLRVKQREDSLECKMRREDDSLLFREEEQQREEEKELRRRKGLLPMKYSGQSQLLFNTWWSTVRTTVYAVTLDLFSWRQRKVTRWIVFWGSEWSRMYNNEDEAGGEERVREYDGRKQEEPLFLRKSRQELVTTTMLLPLLVSQEEEIGWTGGDRKMFKHEYLLRRRSWIGWGAN